MRICIYISDDAPETTLFVREGAPMPANAKSTSGDILRQSLSKR
jgi:hypothetical protein